MGTRRPPEAWLELGWVFGYNGHTARNNVKATSEGKLVYYVAGVGVLHDINVRKQTFYTGHSDDITSLALTSDRRMAATGQEGKDAYITVWDASTATTVSVIRDGHSHGVSTLAFSTDGKQLASVGGPDNKQELMVWDWRKGRRIAHNIAHSSKVEEVEWELGSSSRLVTCGKRHVKFWKLRGNVLQAQSAVFGSEPITDQVSVSHLLDGRAVTGSVAGHLYVWERNKLVSVIKDVHPGGVLVTEVHAGSLFSGGRDGTIAMFDKQLNRISTISEPSSQVHDTKGSIHSLSVFDHKIVVGTEKNEVWVMTLEHSGECVPECVVQGHTLGEVWGLATHPSRSLAITASDDHTIRLWDLEERRPMATSVVSEAARAVAYSPDGQHVAVGLASGAFLVLVVENLVEEHQVSDRKEARHDLKFSPSGAFLAVASNDGFVDIYLVNDGYQRGQVLQGASASITHLDWSIDSKYIQLNSGASERIIYNVSKAAIVMESSIPDLEWSTWTGVLGPQVAGIWHKYADVSDVNACDANFSLGVIATGDDYGLVKIFRFPCAKRGSKCRGFIGHSAHVTNVRWTSDSKYVVSTGGADHAVFVWKFHSSKSDLPLEEKVRLPSSLEEGSDDDVLDTEDELEGIPELTVDLEEELGDKKTKKRQRRKNQTKSGISEVEVIGTSTFAKRRDAGESKTDDDIDPPAQALHMKHVFGFRSQECRNNAHLLNNGHVVYHVAAVGVVMDPVTRRQKHYLLHTDDILCLAVHPGGELAASGQMGREATIHVWNTLEVRILSLLQGGHSRGVSIVAFSGDGQRLASLGLDDHHTLVLWNWVKGQRLALARGHSDHIFGLRFSPNNNNRLLTFGVRHAKFWSQAGGGLTYRQLVLGKEFRQNTILSSSVAGGEGSPDWWLLGLSSGYVLVVKDVRVERSVKAHKVPVYAILVTSENIWTAGQDGLVRQWDSEMQDCLKVFRVIDHFLEEMTSVSLTSSQPGIRGLSTAPGTNMPILVATKQAELLLLDADGRFRILVQGHSKGEVWGLDTHPCLREAVTVGEDNTLRRWSLEGYAMGSANLRKSGRCVHFHPNTSFLVVGFLDGSVALYMYPTLEKAGGAHHRSESISDVKFSPDGRFLAVGSHESVVDLYVVDTDGDAANQEGSGLRRVGLCRGPSSWITHLTWHQDSRLLQVNTGAGEVLFYEAPHGTRQLIPEATTSELAWASPLTCPLDATLEGVWGPEMDLTDINAVATANYLLLVASAADDEGLVRLFKYPSKGRFKKHRQYRGHSAHATNVKWSYDDSFVVTTGGRDTAVIVWQVLAEGSSAKLPDTTDGAFLNDLPEEELTVMDIEAAGLEKEDIPGNTLCHANTVNNNTLERMSSIASGRTKLPQLRTMHTAGRPRALPTLTADDRTIFYCSGSVIGCLTITEVGIQDHRLGYGEHETAVTALAISPAELSVVATAQLGRQLDSFEEKIEGCALIHMWRASDGSNLAVLRGGPQAAITALSFSPSGRLLASLADATTVHVFNWVKGADVAHVDLKAGMVMSLVHSGETTMALLSPRSLFFLELVGNSLVTTRGHIPSGLLPSNAAFNCLGASPDGILFVGCSDGSVVQWKGRTATFRVVPPDDPTTVPPVRMTLAAGQGAVFTACRLAFQIVVRCYTVDKEGLHFFSDSKITSPAEDWVPMSAKLGGRLLVLGARRYHAFIVLDLKSGKFTLIEHG